tara:strand:- start:195 stop:446 length:252 start_codon:yes stop_codon:yes gene_type:complete
MKQDNLSRYMLTDLYYLQEKLRDIHEMISCEDLDEIFDRVPSGVETRINIGKNLNDARQCLHRAHLALLSASKRNREVENVPA